MLSCPRQKKESCLNNNKFYKSKGTYRFSFNGKEHDDEIYGTDNSYDYGARMQDPRLGRFFSVDPLTKKYPFYTPFQFAGNTPILATDMDGLEPKIAPSQSGNSGQTNGGSSTPARVAEIKLPSLSPDAVKKFEQGQKDLAEQQKKDAEAEKPPLHPLPSTQALGDNVVQMAPKNPILQNAQSSTGQSSDAAVDDLVGTSVTALDAANKTLNQGAGTFGVVDKTLGGMGLIISIHSLYNAQTTGQTVDNAIDVMIGTGGLIGSFGVPGIGQASMAAGLGKMTIEGIPEIYSQAMEYNLNKWSDHGTHYQALKEHPYVPATKTHVSQHR